MLQEIPGRKVKIKRRKYREMMTVMNRQKDTRKRKMIKIEAQAQEVEQDQDPGAG